VFWLGWVLAVRWTKPKHGKDQEVSNWDHSRHVLSRATHATNVSNGTGRRTWPDIFPRLCFTVQLMIVDLKRRKLHIKEKI